MKYFYFVSFTCDSGFGNLEIISSEEITNLSHIREMERQICVTTPSVKNPAILNFQLLRTEET